MRSGFKWRWAYLPVILVLGLIWYEFWASGTLKDPGSSSPVVQDETKPAETVPATVVAVVTPASEPAKPVIAVPVLNPFDRLLKDPPPISISVQNATFKQTIDELNRSLACEIPITLNGGGQDNKLITLELKDQPFWDVLQAIEAQRPFDMQDNGRGLMVQQYGQGVKQFERKGAAILYATQLSYLRTSSGQARPGDPVQPRMQLQVYAVVDPRVHVIRHSQIMMLSGEDDLGQPMDTSNNGSGMQNTESNCWQQSLTWPAPEKLGKKLKIVCAYTFSAQGGEQEVSLDDIENKKDQAFDFGDRRLRLARFDTNNGHMMIQIVPADEDVEPTKMSMTIMDGQSKEVGTIQGLNGQVPATGGPYKMTLKGPRVRVVTASFTLADVPMP